MVYSEIIGLNKMKTTLEIKHINKSFFGLKVLEDISFSLQSGTITSLFGDNGCGKSTLFNIITGFLIPNRGEVIFNGHNISGLSPADISQIGIGRVWQSPRILKNLSLKDNMLIASKNHPGEKAINYLIRMSHIKKEEKIQKEKAIDILTDLGLARKLQKTAGSLSLGEQKLLSIGMLLMNDSLLLMLDEPFAGVHVLMIDHISDVLKDLTKKGKAIFLIEHNRKKASEISDNSFLLIKGKITIPEILNV